jgi:hypothetical protein
MFQLGMNTSDTVTLAASPAPTGPAWAGSRTSDAATTSATSATTQSRLRAAARLLREREPRLAAFGAVLLCLIVPMAAGWSLDDRLVQGANVWIKPMKFALSIAVFAFTTAWFVGHLPVSRRRGRHVDLIVWLLIGSGAFELAYITIQAALGEASHYNVGDPFHFVMYTLMGIGATLLTATQPLLGWQLYRHPDPDRPAAYRQAVITGLVLTFVLGAGVGSLLGGLEPPRTGSQVPLLGWALQGGDLRPAHFAGIHAAQFLPLIGFAVVAWRLPRPRLLVSTATLAYVALSLWLTAWGLATRA